MPEGLVFSCEDGQCTWQWNPNRYPVEEITLRIRQRGGGAELRKVRNTGEIVLPEAEEVMEIVTDEVEEGRRRRDPDRWRGS